MTDHSMLGTDRLKHLEFIQAIITRLGTSSFLIKGWTLTIAAAFFAVLGGQLNWGIALTGLIPIMTFWFLDGHFLWQERLFRSLYEDLRQPNANVELMSMNINPYKGTNTWRQAAFSPTLVLFYGALALIDVALVVTAIVRR